MVATTTLMDHELNKSTHDPEVDRLIEEARRVSGKNWQVIVTKHRDERFFAPTRISKNWQLCVYIGGCLPWQVITCAKDRDTVFAYLAGVIAGSLNLDDILHQEHCTYPTCRCPFDMGPDHQCLKGLPVIRK